MDAKKAREISEENKYKEVDQSLSMVFKEINIVCKDGLTYISWYGLNSSQQIRLMKLGYEVTKLDEKEDNEAKFLISWSNSQ